MVYNISFMDTSNTLIDVTEGVNTSSGGFFVSAFLVVLFMVMLNMSEYDIVKSLMLSSFITSVVTVLFSFAELIDFNWVQLPVAVLVASIVIYFFQER